MSRSAIRGLLAVGAALAVSLSLSLPAAADVAAPNTLSGADQASISQKLADAGVNSADIDTLIQKLINGVAWDSENGSAPVTTKTTTQGSVVKKTDRYADGSVIITSTDNPKPNAFQPGNPGLIQPMSTGTSGCVQSTSTAYYAKWVDCFSKVDHVTFWLGFYYDKTVYPAAVGAITRYHDPQYGLWGGSITNPVLSRWSGQNSVRLNVDANVTYTGITVFSGNSWMQVTLGKSYVVTLTNN